MKFVIPGAHIRIFGKAVHSLAKIGEELYIEPLDNGLAFRTLNLSRSAYMCFIFAPEIFEVFDCTNNITDDEERPKLKISMKSCLAVFKSLSSVEKLTEKCKIGVNSSFTKVIFQLHQKSGIVKTFHLPFIECETMQAVFSREDSPNFILVSSKLLTETLHNFQLNEEEISLKVTSDKALLQNNVDDERDPNKVIHTELTLEREEFETFNIGFDACVTFCLKELRAFLMFADVGDFDIKLHFENGGQPIIFSMDLPDVFVADLVLATLAQNGDSEAVKIPNATTLNKKTTTKNVTKKNRTVAVINAESSNSTNNNAQCPVQKLPNRTEDDSNKRLRSEASCSTAYVPLPPNESQKNDGNKTKDDAIHNFDSHLQGNGEIEESMDADEIIPGSPPSKKFKSLFLNFSSSQTASQDSAREVMVYETDDDDD